MNEVKVPCVSIIVPAYNAELTISDTIASLMSQTLSNFEVIVVDDCSTDSTGSIIRELSNKFDNLNCVELAENVGVHEARLAGVRCANGSWIGFIDADDFAKVSMYRKMYEAGVSSRVDIVICGSERVRSNRTYHSEKVSFLRDKKVTDDVFLKFCNFEFGTPALWNKLYKASIVKKYADLKFLWRQNINEDLILNLFCFHDAVAVYLMSDVLHEYHFNQSSVTSKIDPVRAFVETYRAYALAVYHFSERGLFPLSCVIDMYRMQISMQPYIVRDLTQFEKYEGLIEEAVSSLCASNPSALMMIATRAHSPYEIFKSLSIRLFKKAFIVARNMFFRR